MRYGLLRRLPFGCTAALKSNAAVCFFALAARGGQLVLDPPAEPVFLERAIDGDTILLWRERVGVRLAGIDTPELRGACTQEKTAARVAKARLEAILAAAKRVEIRECQGRTEKFGRELCHVYADGRDVGLQLVAEGLARHYAGKQRAPWCP